MLLRVFVLMENGDFEISEAFFNPSRARDWIPEQHPRDNEGKFSDKGGSGDVARSVKKAGKKLRSWEKKIGEVEKSASELEKAKVRLLKIKKEGISKEDWKKAVEKRDEKRKKSALAKQAKLDAFRKKNRTDG
jgi:hypothetical protein